MTGDSGFELLKLIEEWEPSDRSTELQQALGEGDWMRSSCGHFQTSVFVSFICCLH